MAYVQFDIYFRNEEPNYWDIEGANLEALETASSSILEETQWVGGHKEKFKELVSGLKQHFTASEPKLANEPEVTSSEE